MRKLNVLVLGSGAREHAVCMKFSQSKELNKLYCIPGNAGIEKHAEIFNNIDILDFQSIKKFTVEKNIDLIFVGPEMPLVNGIKDYFDDSKLKVFGPSANASKLEGSKIYTKNLFAKYNIPTPSYNTFFSSDDARYFINSIKNYPIVIKADGLAAGKGVMIAADEKEALMCIKDMMDHKKFKSAGEKIVIEKFINGKELSYEIIVDNDKYIDLKPSQDYKKIFDGDKGANTGGMGNISPPPWIDESLENKIKCKLVKKLIDSISEERIAYSGVLFIGIMVTGSDMEILELNVRLGDPESQVVLPLLKTDFLESVYMVANGEIDKVKLEWHDNYATCVVLSSKGYPGEYEKGMEIHGLDTLEDQKDILIFHAGTIKREKKLFTNGGRVLNVVGLGKTPSQSIKKAYEAVSNINFNGMYYRKDIGQ